MLSLWPWPYQSHPLWASLSFPRWSKLKLFPVAFIRQSAKEINVPKLSIRIIVISLFLPCAAIGCPSRLGGKTMACDWRTEISLRMTSLMLSILIGELVIWCQMASLNGKKYIRTGESIYVLLFIRRHL